MRTRTPKPPRVCTHELAQWLTSGAYHILRCVHCHHEIEREFGVRQRKVNTMLHKDLNTGVYAPFNPKGWL